MPREDAFFAIPVESYSDEVTDDGERPKHVSGAVDVGYAGCYITLPSAFGQHAGKRYWVGRVDADVSQLVTLEGRPGVVSGREAANSGRLLDVLSDHYGTTVTWDTVRRSFRPRHGIP